MLGPYVVLVVCITGILQSTFLLTRKPWTKSGQDARHDRAASVTSARLGSPRTLLYTRAATFGFAVCVAVRQSTFTGTMQFKYYTVWSFLLLIAYFGMAAIASWRRVRRIGSDDAAGRTVDLLEHTVIVLYHIMLTTVFIVDITTWTVLYPMIKRTTTGAELERIKKLMLCFTSYIQHGGNAILVLTDFALNDISIHPYLFGWVGLWSVTFGAWAILWYRLSGEWLYPFINYTKPWAPIAYIGLYVGHWLFFGCVVGMQGLKERLLTASRDKQLAHAKEQ